MSNFNMNNGGYGLENNVLGMGGNVNGAKLYVFTERAFGPTVIRPYVYQFDQNLVNKLCSGNGAADTLKAMNSMAGIGGSIVPAANGIEVDTRFLDQSYTFVLIVDQRTEPRSEMAFSGRVFRTVYTGYFIDEPISKLSLWTSEPTPNPNAYMIFTHINSFTVNGRVDFSAQGNSSAASIMANSDIVPVSLDHSVMAGDLALCDVGSIANSYSPDAYSDVSVSTGRSLNLSGSALCPVIHDRVKSPKHQLIDIAHGVDMASAMVMSDSHIFNGLESSVIGGQSLVGEDPIDIFQSNLYAHLQRPEMADIQKGINPAEGMTLGHLGNLYPNLEVKPIEVENTMSYGIRDPREANIQTIFSSMVSNVVSATATSSLLGSISFRYSSWAKDAMFGHGGSFEILSNPTMLSSDDQVVGMMENAVHKFTQELESSLFPILLAAGGEFDVMVSYNSTGATNVDLAFLDYTADDRGYYVANNNLGGIISPAVGLEAQSDNNKFQFDALVNELSHNNPS